MKWKEVRELVGGQEWRRKALILLYVHLLRIPITKASLQKGETCWLFYYTTILNVGFTEQRQILLYVLLLLNALLNIATSSNWLIPTLSVMHLHAHLAQALLSGSNRLRFAQLPGIMGEEVGKLAPRARDLEDFIHALQEKVDGRIGEVKKAVETWGRIELVDAVFEGMS